MYCNCSVYEHLAVQYSSVSTDKVAAVMAQCFTESLRALLNYSQHLLQTAIQCALKPRAEVVLLLDLFCCISDIFFFVSSSTPTRSRSNLRKLLCLYRVAKALKIVFAF